MEHGLEPGLEPATGRRPEGTLPGLPRHRLLPRLDARSPPPRTRRVGMLRDVRGDGIRHRPDGGREKSRPSGLTRGLCRSRILLSFRARLAWRRGGRAPRERSPLMLGGPSSSSAHDFRTAPLDGSCSSLYDRCVMSYLENSSGPERGAVREVARMLEMLEFLRKYPPVDFHIPDRSRPGGTIFEPHPPPQRGQEEGPARGPAQRKVMAKSSGLRPGS